MSVLTLGWGDIGGSGLVSLRLGGVCALFSLRPRCAYWMEWGLKYSRQARTLLKATGLSCASKRFVHSFMTCTSICAYIFHDCSQSCGQLLYALRCESRPNGDMRIFVDQQPSRSIASIRTLIPSCCSVVDFGYPLPLSFIRWQLL